MDRLLDRLEGDDAVAHAEVGGVYAEKTDAVVTDEGPRERVSFAETGVWCRVFANGAADYRYTTSLDEESLADVADRTIRAGEVLAQDEPARYDALSLHRGVHDGWAAKWIDAVGIKEKVEIVEESLAATGDLDLDRAWVNYADAHVESAVGTTTGSTVRTTLDRTSVDLALSFDDGPTVRRHAGSTEGAAFLDDLPEVFADAAADARALADADRVEGPTGEATVALGPAAAGQLFGFLSRYMEQDVAYAGLSPYQLGDRIGPDELAVEDAIHAGSWAARAYDAEVRPTSPVKLVEGGRVVSRLHDTASAAAEGAAPAGNAVSSLGFEQPPRIHARHLEVAPGEVSRSALREGADAYVERFDEPWLRDEFERVHRSGYVPPSVLYAKDIDRKTVERPERGHADLPVSEGFRLVDGERAGRIEGLSLAFEPSTLRGITAIGAARRTITGVDEKHKSRLPYAVTAPGIRLAATLRRD